MSTQATTSVITSSSVSTSSQIPEASNASTNPTVSSSTVADVPMTTSITNNTVPTSSATMNNTSVKMTQMAYNTEMVNYQTESGLTAANNSAMEDMYKNTDVNPDAKPLTYYIHEVGENGDSRLYEYTYDDVDALIEQKERDNTTKEEMRSIKNKKLVTDNTGKKYYYDPKTSKLTSYRDGSSINNQLDNISERINALSVESEDNTKVVKDKRNAREVQEKMLFPTLDDESIVYLDNNFGNSEHPEATTVVSQEKTNSVNEIKVSKREAKKIIEENKLTEEEAMEELVEETVEEKEKRGMSMFDKVAIALFVLVLLGLVLWFLNSKYHFVPTLGKNTPKFQAVSNYNRVLSKVRGNLN